MSCRDILDLIFLITNGFFMLTAVYWPKIYGGGIWSRVVFTTNFIAVLMSFGGLIARGTL